MCIRRKYPEAVPLFGGKKLCGEVNLAGRMASGVEGYHHYWSRVPSRKG